MSCVMEWKRSFIGLLIFTALLGPPHAVASGRPKGVFPPAELRTVHGASAAGSCSLLSRPAPTIPATPPLLAEMQESKDSVTYSTPSPAENIQDGSRFRSPEAEEEWKREKAWEMLDSMHLGVNTGSSRDSSSGSTGNGGSDRNSSNGR